MAAKPVKKKKANLWPVWVFFITFALTMFMSFISETALSSVSLPVAILVLFCFILLGIMFDILGVAVTSGDIVAYNAMASKRIRGAKEAIILIKKASTISNICNDIVGDICGILSGAMGASIVVSIMKNVDTISELLCGVLVSSLIAAMTVSGKAAGKGIAMQYSHEIVFFAGKVISVFDKKSGKKAKKK